MRLQRRNVIHHVACSVIIKCKMDHWFNMRCSLFIYIQNDFIKAWSKVQSQLSLHLVSVFQFNKTRELSLCYGEISVIIFHNFMQFINFIFANQYSEKMIQVLEALFFIVFSPLNQQNISRNHCSVKHLISLTRKPSIKNGACPIYLRNDPKRTFKSHNRDRTNLLLRFTVLARVPYLSGFFI